MLTTEFCIRTVALSAIAQNIQSHFTLAQKQAALVNGFKFIDI